MDDELAPLIAAIEAARTDVLGVTASLSPAQGAYAMGDGWSIAEVIEHLYLAELLGIVKLWSAADNLRSGRRWMEDLPHRGKPIERVVADTWRVREAAPPDATPRVGGPLACWRTALASLGPVLAGLSSHLDGLPLDEIVAPHFLSGPLDARQRLEFLRFHLERHLRQICRTVENRDFPR